MNLKSLIFIIAILFFSFSLNPNKKNCSLNIKLKNFSISFNTYNNKK